MVNYIAIGSLVTLDLHTRLLTRTRDGECVTLPASACLCLAALVEAQGQILSQEQLMDIGWRSAGVEVTDNSVRVMVNKLRRALASLEMQDAIALVAVTRSGYRLIIREESPPEPSADSVEIAPTPQPPEMPVEATPSPPSATPAPRRKRLLRSAAFAVCGMLIGILIALSVKNAFVPSPQSIEFILWQGEGIPPGHIVMVQKNRVSQTELIQATLHTYTEYVLERRVHYRPGKILYITTGTGKIDKYQAVIACQKPIQEQKNDCESFYFHLY